MQASQPPTPVHRPRTLVIWLLIMVPWSLILLLLAWGSFTQLYELRIRPIEAQHGEILDQLSHQLSRELGYFSQLTLLLKRSEALAQSLQLDTPPDRNRIAQLFTRISRSSPLISQLRWLDQQGREQVRVNIAGRTAYRVPEPGLQDKSQRYYVVAAQGLGENQVYFSPLDLNIEHGSIVTPLEPTIRTVIRTGVRDSLQPGLLILNFNLSSLFQQIRHQAGANTEPKLVNSSGYWMLHPNPALEWGFLRNNGEQVVSRQYPDLWQHMQQTPSARGVKLYNRLWSYTRIEPTTVADTAGPLTRSGWYLIMSTPKGRLEALQQELILPITLVTLFMLLGSGLLAYRFAHGEVQRLQLLQQLRREQQELSRTNFELTESVQRQQLLQDELVETRKLSALGMTVAGIAHELNTPTGGALVTLSTLEQSRRSLQQAVQTASLTQTAMHDYLQQTDAGLALIRKHLNKATGLIRSFKRLAIDRSLDEPISFRLQACSSDLLNSLHPQLKQQPVTLHSSLPDCELFSHPGILSQVLQNLIENALQHAFSADSADSADSAEHSGHIWLEGQLLEHNRLELVVRDNGNGIAESLQHTLFDPFVTSGRSQGHTGLGLHLVHQWVTQLLQGHIHMGSSPRQGTRFTLNLPLDIRGRQTSP